MAHSRQADHANWPPAELIAIGDPNPRLRINAVHALKRFRDPCHELVDALMKMLREDVDSNVRQAVVTTLLRMAPHDPDVHRAFIRALESDESAAVRVAAINSLAFAAACENSVESIVVATLLKAFSSDPHPRVTAVAANALAQLAPSNREVLASFVKAIREDRTSSKSVAARQALQTIGHNAFRESVALLTSEECILKQPAAPASDNPSPDNPSPDISQVTSALIDVLRGEVDPDIRALAATKLAGLVPSDANVRATLVSCLSRDDNSIVRMAAAKALARFPPIDPDVTAAFLKTLRDEQDLLVLEEVEHALAECGRTDPGVRAALLKVVQEQDDNDDRERALIAIAIIGPAHSDIRAGLLGLLTKEADPCTRAMAASALGPIAGIDGEVGSTLIEVTKTDPDLWVREVAVEALGRAPFPQIRSALLSLLQDAPNSALRIATISLLEPGVASDQDVRSALLATLQNDCDVDVRLCAALSLVNSGGAIMPSVPSIMESSSALSIDDATIVRWLRTISNDRDWTSDPELWEFAPHLLLSLFRPAHIPALAHLRFYQRIQKSWLRRTGVPGNPEDLLPDAFQEFALCLLKPACQRFARRPEHYFKLPGLVRNLAIKSAESLLPFQERDFSGAIMEHPLPQGDFLSSREAMTMAGRNSDMSVVENAILRELTQKLHDYIYLKKSGIKQALLVQNLLKKVAYADLSAVLPGAKNLRRTLDTEVKVLLQELNLPNRNALELLADLLVQEFMVGVVPDTMKINKRE